MAGEGGRLYADKESGTWSSRSRRGSKWIVRTGQSQPGYKGPPVIQIHGQTASLEGWGGQASTGTPEKEAPPPRLASPRSSGTATEGEMPLHMRPDHPWADLSASDGEAMETLETPHRRFTQMHAHSSAKSAVATAALYTAPTAPMSSSQAHRLALEHTYIQGDENRLCGLLEDLRKVRAVGASSRLCHPSHQVLEKAKDLNSVRFRHGDEHDRLTMAIQAVQSRRLTDVLNPDWPSLESLQYSPVTAIAAAAQCRRQVVGAPPVKMWMPTIGEVVEIGQLLDTCTSYRGPPCTIDSPGVTVPECEVLSDLFKRLSVCRTHLLFQISCTHPSEMAKMETRMSALHNEHAALGALVSCANARLIGPWRDGWQPPYQLGPQMLPIWDSLEMTPEQKWQLFSMRERARDIIVAAKSAHSCSLDMATDLASASPDASVADNIALLDLVEASEQAKFTVPGTEFMVFQTALCNIWSPLQTARFWVSAFVLYTSIPGLRFEIADFMRFAAACFLDEELGAWLDDTLPPSWWPDS